MSGETGRHRRGAADDDDDEPQTTVQETTTAITPPPAPAAPPSAPAPPTRVRAKAPAAAAVKPPTLAAAHADPTAAAPPSTVTAPAPVAAATAAESPEEDNRDASDDEVDNVLSAASKDLAAQLEAIDYDTLTYTALLEIMKRATRPVVEEIMAQREQQVETSIQQQQNQRVERFLDVAATSAADAGNSNEEEAVDGYRYNMMLTRLFEALNRNNEGSAMTERNQLPVPLLERMGKKKTVIANFGRICDAFHRPMEDVKDFIEKELSVRGNLDSNNALILKLEIRRQTDFDRVLIKYLDEYVKCNSCHRIDTTLTKDGRRLELRCNVCTATRTVTAASTATFSAQIEKRSRQRAAMTL